MAGDLAEGSEGSEIKDLAFEPLEILKYLPDFLDKNKLKEPFYKPQGLDYFVYGLGVNKLTVMLNEEGIPLILSYDPESRELGEEILDIFNTFGIQAVFQKFEPKKS